MLYRSSHTYTYHTQTVVCPHKAIRGDMTIQLPVNSTHLRISRPSLTVLEHTTTVTQPPPQPREEPPDGDSLVRNLCTQGKAVLVARCR